MLTFNDNVLYLAKVKGSEKSPYSNMQMHKLRKIGTYQFRGYGVSSSTTNK